MKEFPKLLYNSIKGESLCAKRTHIIGDMPENVFFLDFSARLVSEAVVILKETSVCKHFTVYQCIGGGFYHLLDLPTSPRPMAY